jgi:hypothetical protein
MKRTNKMQALVDSELEHIPKAGGIEQGLLRAAYNAARLHSLGRRSSRSQSANDVLQECIQVLKREDPDARFIYDKEFFENGV